MFQLFLVFGTLWVKAFGRVQDSRPSVNERRRHTICLKPWFRHERICLYSDHSILAEHRLAHTRETEFNKPDGTRHVSKHSPRHPECLQTPYPTSIWGQPVYLSNQDLGPMGGFSGTPPPFRMCLNQGFKQVSTVYFFSKKVKVLRFSKFYNSQNECWIFSTIHCFLQFSKLINLKILQC